MAMFVNVFFLAFVLFIVNRMKALLQKNASNVPLVASAWSDGIQGKPFRALVQTGYDTVSSKASRVTSFEGSC